MSESGEGAAALPQGDGVTAGMLLRRAREAAGLHVAALAVSLKVPVRKLEALEADRFDLLPDLVFARALASSVCRTLRVDAQPVLERLPQMVVPRLVRDIDGINAPFRGPSDVARPSWLDQLSRPVVLGVFGLLLGALVLVFLPRTFLEDAVTAVQPDPAPPAPVAAPAPTVVVALADATSPPAVATPQAVSPADSSPGQLSPTVVLTPSAGLGRDAAVAPPPAASAALPVAAPPTGAVVVFRAREPSWIQVTDARGVVALRRMLEAGESAGASGALPLSVTVGKASTIEVLVRGKRFDLTAIARDDVARFEVK